MLAISATSLQTTSRILQIMRTAQKNNLERSLNIIQNNSKITRNSVTSENCPVLLQANWNLQVGAVLVPFNKISLVRKSVNTTAIIISILTIKIFPACLQSRQDFCVCRSLIHFVLLKRRTCILKGLLFLVMLLHLFFMNRYNMCTLLRSLTMHMLFNMIICL